MAQISGNTCNIITLSPMEVECVVTNASTPIASNGSVQVLINGGTAPYSVSWTNGQQGSTLTGLQPGTYSAVVTDYYGDYTVTTECVVDYDSFYLDKLLECADISSPNIYVFYDGTSLDETKATEASNSIREWYSEKTNEGFGGLLYEGVVGDNNNNGENWLWWATYPYLGSLTGGTLSDTTPVELFGLNNESVSNSIANSNRCKNSSGPCIPKNISFNFENTTYQRISRGLNINNGSPDPRSQGVPFNAPSSLNGQNTGIYGDFNGGDTNYIVICVIDEADGAVGLYHGQIDGTSENPTKSDLYNEPFVLKGAGWDASNSLAPSDRYVGDYEGFLQVWEDIVVNQNGSFNGLIYPVCDSEPQRISFVQHSVATIEGETITSSEYTSKYGGSITNVGPENLNLSALTRTNVYTALTTNSVYTSLPVQYQQGAGLKNFGWQVDPDVTDFTSIVVGDTLNDFFENIQLSNNAIYIEQGNTFNPSLIYSFNEIDGCYQFDSTELWTGQTYSAVTINSPYNDCIECQPVTPNPPIQPYLCLSDFFNTTQYTFTPNGTDSNGNYTWVNSDNSLTMSYNTTTRSWEITNWSNVGGGTMGFNQNPPSIPLGLWTNYGVSTESVWFVTQGDCQGIPLSVTSTTSDPSCVGGTGSVTLVGAGGTPPYQYIIPGITSSLQNSGIFTNLPSGTYNGTVQDSGLNTATTSFTIGTGGNAVTYTMTITTSNLQTSTGFYTVTKSYNYNINISPQLPSGSSIAFTLRLAHTQEKGGVVPGSTDVTFTKNFTVNKNGGSVTTSDGSVTSSTGLVCGDSTKYIDTYETDSIAITMTSGDVVNGFVSQTTTLNNLNNNCNCPTYGDYDTSLQIINTSLKGTPCEFLTPIITPISTETYVEGCKSNT